MKNEKILFVPDVHIPFHDKRAWNLLLKAMRSWKPDTIIVLGDFVDFYCISDYIKDPEIKITLEDEIKAGEVALEQLEGLGARNLFYLAGNHEHRLERYLRKNAPALVESHPRVDQMLRLSEHGWKYVPYQSGTGILEYGRVRIAHEGRGTGKTAAYNTINLFHGCAIFGHSHKFQYVIQGDITGSPYVGASFGWLGDKKQCEYMSQVKIDKEWALGFGIGRKAVNGITYISPIPLVKYTCCVEGRIFKG